MPGFTDTSTTLQNVAQSVNALSQTYINVQGAQVTTDIISATVIRTQPSRVATVSVISAGSAVGAIYDARIASATTGQIYVIPMTVGVFVVNMPTNNGIVVSPGTGQKIAVSWSQNIQAQGA